MAFRNTNSAESWERIYEAFSQVNFTSFDALTIKQSLIDYLRIYYAEVFNDLIQSSELIAMLEMFAYVAEQLAYRVDMVSHENFITTAQRKQSILRLAKLISYKATRNIPVRGLVKITSLSTSERVIDSRGVDLSGLVITWNDPNNANWKEQFFLVANRVLTSRFGQPQKSFQVGDVVMDLYALNATARSFTNGVFPFTAQTGLDNHPMEVVPADIDENGPLEREPDLAAPLSIIYANDGIGDGSDYTGFLMYVKQGQLDRIDYNIVDKLPNRRLDFLPNNVNHTDVWVQKVDESGNIVQRWKQVETVNEQNLIFNDDRTTRLKYEVDTLENDQIAIVFGDGDFTEVPQGQFRFWMRQSANRSLVIAKNKVVNEVMPFSYISSTGNTETCTLTFSLTTTLQNGSGSETIEHVRQSAPATYYAQNRMVNGQDYNTYLLKDPSILRLKTVNRTFAGQPKYLDWNDASGAYENVKIFGDDLVMRYELGLDSLTTSTSGQALIDSVIEPLLSSNGVVNAMLHLSATTPATRGVVSSPRRTFIEDNRANLFKSGGSYVKLIDGATPDGSLKEKTAMQGLIDRHWYGEPLEYVEGTNNQVWARIPDPDLNPKDDSRIYASSVPRTIDGVTKFPPGDIGSGLQPIAEQDYFALRYNRYMVGVGMATLTMHEVPAGSVEGEVWTIEVAADGETLNVRSSHRGTFNTGSIDSTYEITPVGFNAPQDFFSITNVITPFEPGDAYIVDTVYDLALPAPHLKLVARTAQMFPEAFNNNGGNFGPGTINLNGWWEILGYSQLQHYSGGQIVDGDELLFSADETQKEHSWLIFVRKVRQQPTNNVIGYEIHHRNVKLTVESPTTKFWFNEVDQILDSDTKKRVFDNIKILRSNLLPNGSPLGKSQVYDVVGAVKDGAGTIDFHKLQVVPSDLMQEDSSGDLVPDRLLQFEMFAEGQYEYYTLSPFDIVGGELISFTQIPDIGEVGANLPIASVDGVQFAIDNGASFSVYTASSGLWVLSGVANTGSSLPSPSANGTVFVDTDDELMFTASSETWGNGVSIDIGSTFPLLPNDGDLFFYPANLTPYVYSSGQYMPQQMVAGAGTVLPLHYTDGQQFFDTSTNLLHTVVSGAWDSGVQVSYGPALPISADSQFYDETEHKLFTNSSGSWDSGVVVEFGAGLPLIVIIGDTFYNSGNSTIYKSNGTAWLPVAIYAEVTQEELVSKTNGQQFFDTSTQKIHTIVAGHWNPGVVALSGVSLPTDSTDGSLFYVDGVLFEAVSGKWLNQGAIPSGLTLPSNFADGYRFLNSSTGNIHTSLSGFWNSGDTPENKSQADINGVTYSYIDDNWVQDSIGSERVSFVGEQTAVIFEAGSFIDNTMTYGRRQMVNNNHEGLDFMWQHFAPHTNIVDPSPTNIHDAYVLTKGYYDSVVSYLRGMTDVAPLAPSPLDLRSAYGYLLKNKMLSDTVVLHPGKLRLLFGALAEPQFRAKFKVVRAPGATLTNERVKEELLNVVNTYFDVSNWDFGETFYATELLALMHQRLPTEIASVVLVPLYSTNSFGDMFTVECGFDEILHSAAQLTDIEIVEALTPTIIRQVR